MAALEEIFGMIGGWLRSFVELLFGLALVLLVVYVLFGVGVDVIAAVSDFVESFTSRGVIGLIAFLIILAIFKK